MPLDCKFLVLIKNKKYLERYGEMKNEKVVLEQNENKREKELFVVNLEWWLLPQ